MPAGVPCVLEILKNFFQEVFKVGFGATAPTKNFESKKMLFFQNLCDILFSYFITGVENHAKHH